MPDGGSFPSSYHPTLIEEQTPPVKSGGPDCWLLVMTDMEDRRKHGIEKYGEPVRPGNGRDPLIDAYQEALDLCVYLRQAIEERRAGGGSGIAGSGSGQGDEAGKGESVPSPSP